MGDAAQSELWVPTVVRRVVRISRTSTQVVIVETDAGRGYLKALGTPAGEHALAREWIGTKLAAAMGLLTLTHAITHYDGTPEIRFYPPKHDPPGTPGPLARPGPAFITRAEKLATLEAGKVALDRVRNPADFAKLVVFDTWTINPDRYFPDETIRHPNRKNVAFSREGRNGWLLRAIDQTHCITREEHLSRRVGNIEHWQDDKLYGLFPEFHPFMQQAYIEQAVQSLRAVTREQIEAAVAGVPREWQLEDSAREAVVRFLWTRKGFVADTVGRAIAGAVVQPPSRQEGEAGGAGEAIGGFDESGGAT